MASCCNQRHRVLPLIEATNPAWPTSRTRSDVLQRDNGNSCSEGSSQAQAFTWTTNSGGKSPGATRTITFFQSRKPLGEEPLAPHRDHITAGSQPLRNIVVAPSFRGEQNHLGALDLKIRQRILTARLFNSAASEDDSRMRKGLV